MTVRMYSSLDTGAPSIPNISSQRLIDNLRLILTAALVDGYGSQPAAGWTLVHNHADGFSLSNGEGIISFVHSAIDVVELYLMEAITDASTALPTGVNRRSGPWFDGESTVLRQRYSCSFYGVNTGKAWALVADEKTVTVLCQSGSLLEPSWGGAQALHFGQYYPVVGGTGFCCLGGGLAANSTMTFWLSNTMPGTVLRHPFTGLVSQASAPGYLIIPRSGINASQVTAYNSFNARALQRYRASIGGGGVGINGAASSSTSAVYCGLLRGLLVDPVFGAVRLNQVLPALGVASPTAESRLRAVSIGSQQVWPLYPNANDLGGFVSLNAADWEPLWS